MNNIQEIDKIIESSINSIKFKREPKELYGPLEYLLSIGGKRIRPKICLINYNLFSNNICSEILYPALGLEIFHGFTLIHDDIMDSADLRRNQMTVHKKWSNNIALLSGDVMCIKAYHFICKSPFDKLKIVLEIFNKTTTEVCEGQQFDMNFESIPIISKQDYISMIGLKTASLIAASAQIGAVIAGASEQISRGLYDCFYKLGLAFQIKDDYLDSFGDSNIFGKCIGGDILNNKKTWLFVELQLLASAEQSKEIVNILKMEGQDKIDSMLALYKLLNIKDKAAKEIEMYYNQAIEILNELDLSAIQKEQVIDCAKILVYRDK